MREIRVIKKTYKIYKDDVYTERTVSFIVPDTPERVERAWKDLMNDYPREKGYFLMRTGTELSTITVED